MIDSGEVFRRARQLGIDPGHIHKDYIVNCVLAAIADALPGLTFRGGTALARVYWPDFKGATRPVRPVGGALPVRDSVR